MNLKSIYLPNFFLEKLKRNFFAGLQEHDESVVDWRGGERRGEDDSPRSCLLRPHHHQGNHRQGRGLEGVHQL